MTWQWQERATFLLLVVLAAYCVQTLRLPHLWRRWRARHPNWRKAPPSVFGEFTRDEWLSYRRKNPAALTDHPGGTEK